MERFYIFKCAKCDKYIKYTFTLAKNKKEAGELLAEDIMGHDLACHGADMERPAGEIVALVRNSRKRETINVI